MHQGDTTTQQALLEKLRPSVFWVLGCEYDVHLLCANRLNWCGVVWCGVVCCGPSTDGHV